MNQRKSPEQWCAILADYERSGLSQADFCRHYRLALSTFHYHRKRSGSSSAPAGRLIELRAQRSPKPRPPPPEQRADRPCAWISRFALPSP